MSLVARICCRVGPPIMGALGLLTTERSAYATQEKTVNREIFTNHKNLGAIVVSCPDMNDRLDHSR